MSVHCGLRRVAGLLLLIFGIGCEGTIGQGDPSNRPGPDGSSDAGRDADGSTDPASVLFPIEVLGEAGYTATVAFSIDDDEGIDHLYLRGHRLGYRDGRGGKGSVRLNGGDWVLLDDEHVEVLGLARDYQGIGGPLRVVEVKLPIAGARAGANELQFRFEGTDGHTNGYRILDFNLLRGDAPVLPRSTFAEDDPNTWTPPLPARDDISEGKRLFTQHPLAASPLEPDRMLKARCADCHAYDGRDLAYFNYSNWSIEARAQFHGMSERQAQQVASYIRSLNLDLPTGVTLRDLGRPWNPPYQPGPGLDARPVVRWAAGAGIDAVLPSDAMMKAAVFPEGITKTSIDSRANHNVRETPISLELPDWNDWLPDIHPLDLWGEAFLEEETYLRYLALREDLAGNRENLVASGTFPGALQRFITPAEILRRDFDVGVITHIPANDGRRNIMHWSAVKQWEIMVEFALEERSREIHGPAAELRAWPTRNRNVFEMAPHRTADNQTHFEYQTFLAGKYASTAWYELQVIINPGNPAGALLAPVDWNYQPNHIADLSRAAGGPHHPWRYARTFVVMLQQYNREGTSLQDFGLHQLHPARWAPNTPAGEVFASLESNVRIAIYEAMLNALMNVLERFPPEDLRGHFALEDADFIPSTIIDTSLDSARHTGRFAESWYTATERFGALGVAEPVMMRLRSWGRALWPLGDWDALGR